MTDIEFNQYMCPACGLQTLRWISSLQMVFKLSLKILPEIMVQTDQLYNGEKDT